MHLKRKLYKRGASFEITIPMPLLFGLDLTRKHNVVFSQKDGKWIVSFDKKSKAGITRNLYRRGSSYETTLPLPIILNLDNKKHYQVVFNYNQFWYLDFEEMKDG